MEDFKLRELVVRVLEEAAEPDPHVLAEKVLLELSPYDFEAALRQTLPQYVRVMAHRDRPAMKKIANRERSNTRPEGWSPWVEAIQRGGLRKSRWAVNGEWKFLANFTRVDIEVIVSSAESLEETARAKKKAFQRLLSAFDLNGVNLVGELSDVQIASALAGVEVPE